mmetsp:Transcript_6933/g.19440  ORF Transcript_6933/g.19440 Transcript_6933/m.19440 type:complete len:100 (+) Transcript_6933:1840-2139(+)
MFRLNPLLSYYLIISGMCVSLQQQQHRLFSQHIIQLSLAKLSLLHHSHSGNPSARTILEKKRNKELPGQVDLPRCLFFSSLFRLSPRRVSLCSTSTIPN